MDQATFILKKYWKYKQFRPLQENIISEVLEGKDVLALMPTGGGKSLCFQVPGMVKEGLCLVISPLIALMKDQVENLHKREIKAAAIYTGLSRKEIDITLDNCIYGNYKFLYVSPERLKTDLFIERAKKMNISILAIDEAHCISQWGYDFRPSYLQIAEFREHIDKNIPVIALTATATLEVRQDIIKHLHLASPSVFVKSFARPNLSYVVRKTDNREQQAKKILERVPGTSVFYVNARKASLDWAKKINSWGFSAEYYHGGMSNVERNVRQQAWMQNKSRIIVATNAFGMGIDKPDVRTVVHVALPATLEAYYQEAGRAGRDEKKAYATVLFDDIDGEQLLERIERSYPSPENLKKVYQCLANYYKLAIGSGDGQSFDFDLTDFSKQYSLDPLIIYHSLKRLEEQEIVKLNEAFYQPSRLMFIIDKNTLYEYQVANATMDVLIKTVLRLYGGEAYHNFVKINEKQIADILNVEPRVIFQQLTILNQQEVVIYEKQKDKPQIIFLTPRQDSGKLSLDVKTLIRRKKIELDKAKALMSYLNNDKRCRTLQLLEYFGEVSDQTCGACDVCVKNKNKPDENELKAKILHLLKANAYTTESLIDAINHKNEELVIAVLRMLIDEGEVYYDDDYHLNLKG